MAVAAALLGQRVVRTCLLLLCCVCAFVLFYLMRGGGRGSAETAASSRFSQKQTHPLQPFPAVTQLKSFSRLI